MRKLLALAVASAAVAAFAIPALAATKTVDVGDNWFISKAKNKGTVSVKVGDRVTFKWVGKNEHNVVSSSGPTKIRSGNAKKSGRFTTRTLKKAGTYKLLCEVHGATKQAMRLKVVR